MNDLNNTLDRLMNDTRVRIGAAVVGGLIVIISLIVGNACQTPVRVKSAAVLPEYPINLPMVRRLPGPEPKKGEVVSTRKTALPVRGTLTARR
jgi:hypothetical protein